MLKTNAMSKYQFDPELKKLSKASALLIKTFDNVLIKLTINNY